MDLSELSGSVELRQLVMLNQELGKTIERVNVLELRLATAECKLAEDEKLLEGYRCLHSKVQCPDNPSLFTDNFFLMFTLPCAVDKCVLVSHLCSVLKIQSRIHLVKATGRMGDMCDYYGLVSSVLNTVRSLSSIAIDLQSLCPLLGCEKIFLSARHDVKLVEMALAVMAYDTPCAENFCWDPVEERWWTLGMNYFESRQELLNRTIRLRSLLSDNLETQFLAAVQTNFAGIGAELVD